MNAQGGRDTMPTQKAPAQKPRTAGRAWTEEEKDVVWEKVMHAKANDLPLTDAFRQAAKALPHRSEAAVLVLDCSRDPVVGISSHNTHHVASGEQDRQQQ